MRPHPRSRARSWALHLLYGWDMAGGDDSPTEYADIALVRRRMAPRYRAYTRELVQSVEDHLADIDAMISKYTANWRLERLGAIDRNVLRIGIAELRWSDDTPPKVAITEAVKLAGRYGSEESAGFVNGVLDAVYKQVTPFD